MAQRSLALSQVSCSRTPSTASTAEFLEALYQAAGGSPSVLSHMHKTLGSTETHWFGGWTPLCVSSRSHITARWGWASVTEFEWKLWKDGRILKAGMDTLQNTGGGKSTRGCKSLLCPWTLLFYIHTGAGRLFLSWKHNLYLKLLVYCRESLLTRAG